MFAVGCRRRCSCARSSCTSSARIDFAEAYLVASAEASGVGVVASFDRSIDRAASVRRIEPT